MRCADDVSPAKRGWTWEVGRQKTLLVGGESLSMGTASTTAELALFDVTRRLLPQMALLKRMLI